MKSQRIAEKGRGETLIVVLDDGEEAFSALQEFARKEGVSAASLTAIGAFSRATVGWFDFASKSYKEIAVDEQCEVLSAIGDISTGDDGEASLHVHVVLGLSDGSTRGGHLLKGTVHPTLEIVLTETPAKLRRRKRPELGIALIDADPQQSSRGQ
jgi:predicted DNA-binding protein with PD1-like motif